MYKNIGGLAELDDRAGLENRRTRKGSGGSNPSASALLLRKNMKNFTEHIASDGNSLIEESLLSHIAIEYKVNDIGEGRRIVNEKYGIYDGCEELADFIIKDVWKNIDIDGQYEYTKDQLKNFKNIFFHKIVIDIDTSCDDGGECDDNIDIGNDLLADEIWINIYNDDPTKSSLKGTLMHELTHLYNNYMMLLKGDQNFIKTSRSVMYRNIIDTSSVGLERDLKTALYFLLGYERNAFVAQLKAELEDHKDKINTPREALEILKNCPVYKTYISVNNLIRLRIENSADTDTIANLYRQITGYTGNESSIKILKRLKAQSDKALKKFNTIIPKLCVESLNNRMWHREASFL